jgi:hypothetical protein
MEWKENVGIFYDHYEYFMAIWYNLWPFAIVCGHFGVSFSFWYVWTKKNLATVTTTKSMQPSNPYSKFFG